jgi:hypothetical protein
MNEHHFMCQLCKDKKNIIFYREISQLLEHYKFNHFVCPYQECLDDIFVVFESEEKLNSHLITKHKCVDAHNKMMNFMFDDNQKSSSYKSSQKYMNKPVTKGEFNFTEYINELKERVKAYANNLVQNTKYVSHNEKDSEKYYKDNHYNNNQSYYAKNESRYDDNYNYNYNYNVPPTQKQNKKKAKHGGDYYDSAIQQDDNYNYDNYGNDYRQVNQWNNNKQQPRSREGKKSKNSNNMDIYHSRSSEHTTNIISNRPLEVKIDYSFIFNTTLKVIKDYISDKIIRLETNEDEFILPRETIYQLIIVIDKLEHAKLLELTSLANFGVELDVVRDLRNILSEGVLEKERIYATLNKLEIKKVLIIYKYFYIATKKIDNLFYKIGNIYY